MSTDLSKIYRHRFDDKERADLSRIWRILVSNCFQAWVKPGDAVIDIGAGLCHFINEVTADRKVAFDSNPEVSRYCGSDVEFICGSDLTACSAESSFDVAFVSNFLEHLENSDRVIETLRSIHRLLKPGGRLIVLQPNFALIGPRYFDFIDHKTILTDASLVEALEIAGFEIEYMKRRFLPYTSKSRMPRAPWLVWLYLKCPPAQYVLGKQTLVVATR